MSTFFQNVYGSYKGVTSYKKMQALIEANFERLFNPELDQIDYMRKQQSSKIYRRQCRAFKKRSTMVGNELSSFGSNLHFLNRDENELSDDDENGAEPN